MTHLHVRWMTALALSAASILAHAHGDEPHGDEPHPPVAVPAGAPRFEAATDAFEMVGRLENGALTLFINRFETNEPVLQAQVELESGPLKAVAAYQADQGSYVITDAGLLAALNQPGEHPVVVTLTLGNEADLLDATLTLAADQDDHAAEPRTPVVPAMAGALGVAALGAGAIVLRRRQSTKGAAR
jgi:hypothetical protein|nr:hypothetical protein [uncultured Caldimonas sp.]